MRQGVAPKVMLRRRAPAQRPRGPSAADQIDRERDVSDAPIEHTPRSPPRLPAVHDGPGGCHCRGSTHPSAPARSCRFESLRGRSVRHVSRPVDRTSCVSLSNSGPALACQENLRLDSVGADFSALFTACHDRADEITGSAAVAILRRFRSSATARRRASGAFGSAFREPVAFRCCDDRASHRAAFRLQPNQLSVESRGCDQAAT